MEREVLFKIRRFNPESDDHPYYADYKVPAPKGMVVLEGLWWIKENVDPTLAWRSSCRMGVCGSCGMLINGRPGLACNTQVWDVVGGGSTPTLVLAPLPNFEIVRDLVPDLSPMFEDHARLMPYLVREDSDEQMEPTDQYWQSPQELEEYLQFSYCIKCGCCMAACPTYAADKTYPGPQPLAQAYRFMIDSRDGGFEERKKLLSGDGGPWRCHYAGECSRVCPKGVDPARAIQLMKKQLVLDLLRLAKPRRRGPAPLLPKEKRATKRREGIPEAPPYTVEQEKGQ